ncbi:MAG TPA: hypothetical protein VN875_03600 [Candidatus Binatus sp.]|jgi:hypothetical protein|nr:hypothetical protein [Candidatus Binatus sp.]
MDLSIDVKTAFATIANLELKAKIAIAAVIVALCLTISAFIDTRYIASGSGVTLYWKGSETYIFTEQSHTGYHISYLQLPVVVLMQFYWTPDPSNERDCSVVIHVTPTDVERQRGPCGAQEVKGTLITPYDNKFFALCQSALLCKWTIDGYVMATPEELRKLDPTTLPTLAREDGQVISGWTLHYSPGPGANYEVPLSDGSIISVINRQKKAHSFPWIEVLLLRAGQKPQNLYDVDATPHKATAQEYIATFPPQ